MDDKNNNMRNDWFRKESVVRFLVSLVIATAGVLTAYHATIYGLKADIGTKADRVVVEDINNRLIHIEAILTERVATKAEMRDVRDDLMRRLISIEAKLQMLP